jgi:hypothetical protein
MASPHDHTHNLIQVLDPPPPPPPRFCAMGVGSDCNPYPPRGSQIPNRRFTLWWSPTINRANVYVGFQARCLPHLAVPAEARP